VHHYILLSNNISLYRHNTQNLFYLLNYRHLVYYHSSAVVIIFLWTFMCKNFVMFSFLLYRCLGMELWSKTANSLLKFSRYTKTVFQSVCTNLPVCISTRNVSEFQFLLYPNQCFWFPIVLILALLVRAMGYFLGILTCTHLMALVLKTFFSNTCWTFVYFPETHLVNSLAPF
jgi:hypothetical protein